MNILALIYSFTINGDPIEATIGATVVDKLEEPLDEGAVNIPITVTKKQKKMLGLLKIGIKEVNDSTQETISNKEFTYLIVSDKVTAVSKDLIYEHQLTAIEYTHKLDKYLVNTLTFTKPFPVKRKAPFRYEFSNLGAGTEMFALLPNVEFNERYYVGEEITIKQVGSAKRTGGVIQDVLVKSNAPDNDDIKNITDGDITFNFTTSGNYEIGVGILVNDVFTPISNLIDILWNFNKSLKC